MLEKAMIAGVTHDVEEAVFEVESAEPAELFQALADAEVNVDTVIQIGTGDRLLGPGRGPPRATGALEQLGARGRSAKGSARSAS